MPARLTIITGPARNGKTDRLLGRYREALRDRPPNSTLWLSPTWRAANEARDRLLDGAISGCFSPGVTTFDKFAVEVLRRAGKPIRSLTRLMKRELVRGILADIASRGRLKHFLPIAKTGGLVDLICEFISELKRLEIWPPEFLQACDKRGLSDKDSELYDVYEEYQQSLRDHDLFDLEGRIWSARDVLKKSADLHHKTGVPSVSSASQGFPPAALPSFIVVDGFTDFTRTQHEILDSLAACADEMYISLPLEDEPRRPDLFAKPLKTFESLSKRHPDAAVERIGRSDGGVWPAMERMERLLFINPRKLGEEGACPAVADARASGQPSSSALKIEILAAARQIGEIEMIAARIKRLLIDGAARPDEIAVVFRSPQGMVELVEEVFIRLGIPVAFETGQTLERRPALRALANLLRLDLDDWPFDLLLSVLGSNYFQPDWPEWRNADRSEIERTIRALQIPRGRSRWIDQFAIASSPAGETNDRGFLAKLAASFDALPQRATLSDWAIHWERLAADTGLLRAIGGESAETAPSPSVFRPPPSGEAWRRLITVLKSSQTLAEWLHRRPVELDRRAAYETLLDILGSDRMGNADDQAGRVRVLSATSVRSLRVPYLFLAGLSEKVFPPPDREDRLYSDAEYLRLIEAAPELPLVTRTERARDEMLLFYEAVTRATERLYLSYPALDESAQPLLPSPFLGEVEQVFGPGVIPRVEQIDLSPVPRDDEPLSAAEYRVKAVATALEGNVALLAGFFLEGGLGGGGREQGTRTGNKAQGGRRKKADASRAICDASNLPPTTGPQSTFPLSRSIAAGLALLHSRQDRERFGPGEGIIRGEAARRALAADFSAERTFSATELERYASCPFRFLMERILKIEPVEDLTLEFDVLNRGRAMHDILSLFHKRVNERLKRPGSPSELEPADFDALFTAAIDESLSDEPSNPLLAAMREIDRRQYVEWMSRYQEQCEKYDLQWKDFDSPLLPELFEAAFGRDGEEPPSTAEPLEFVNGGETIRISGRIDRVDVGRLAGKTVFNVLDYKSGEGIKLTLESVRAGTTLQLPLYALAAGELLLADRHPLPWRAGYWYVRNAGYKPRQALRMYSENGGRFKIEPDWEDMRGCLGGVIAELIRAIRRGRFPVCSADEHCTGRCPYSTVCRINHLRALEKTCRPSDNE